MHLTESYSGAIAFLHYWTPEIRQAVFGYYARAHFDASLRSNISPAIGTFSGFGLPHRPSSARSSRSARPHQCREADWKKSGQSESSPIC